MPITSIPVTEAQARQGAGQTYVDVRSTPEFNDGHAPGAVNIPLLEPDEDTGLMMPNADFIRVMKATFATDAPLVIGCQSGRRSARATQMLETFGFTSVVNVEGGYADWRLKGLPVDTSPSTYDDLLVKAET